MLVQRAPTWERVSALRRKTPKMSNGQNRSETSADKSVLSALRSLEGRATVGDVAARTGLAQAQAEESLRRLLESRRGHLEVGQEGALVYRFEPRFVRRDAEPILDRVRAAAWAAFKTAFKVWTLVMLVVYVVVFVVLLLAVLLAGKSRDNNGGGWGGGSRGRSQGHFPIPSFWFWYLLYSPGWGWGRPYYGQRWEQRLGREARVPLYKKVFAFVFGPDRPRPSQAQKDRAVVRLIRSRRGVVTAADLVQLNGLRRADADEELARLMAAYDGDVRVAKGGELAYIFPSLMVSAHGRVAAQPPDPAWRRLETAVPLTGNSRSTDLAIGVANAFNLTAAATAPWVIFPKLGFGGAAAWVGLVWVPLVFSALFFAIPLVRWFSVRRENLARAERNVRKVLLSKVIRASIVGDGAQPVTVGEAAEHVRGSLGEAPASTEALEAQLLALTADWDASITSDESGRIEYRFEQIRQEFVAGEQVRSALALENREVGEIVYSSADSPEESSARDLRAFDRELAQGAPPSASGRGVGPGLSRDLMQPERVAFVDDFEVVMEDDLPGRAVGRDDGRAPRPNGPSSRRA